jgi:hypothetical protein
VRDVSGALVPIQISEKEESRISRAITRGKHKKYFLKILRVQSRCGSGSIFLELQSSTEMGLARVFLEENQTETKMR